MNINVEELKKKIKTEEDLTFVLLTYVLDRVPDAQALSIQKKLSEYYKNL